MRPSLLNYNYWNSCSLANSFFGRSGYGYGTNFSWFAFSPISDYGYGCYNRPYKQFTSTVSLAVAAVATYTIPNAISVTSSNPAFATATINSGVVTVTGVAAGTATISVIDGGGNLVATIVATVA